MASASGVRASAHRWLVVAIATVSVAAVPLVRAGAAVGTDAAPAPAAHRVSNARTVSKTSAAAPAITARHGHLRLAGRRYRFVGLNAYELPTLWGHNAGCGAMVDEGRLDTFFAGLPQHSLVRIWAWQGSMAINYTSRRLDWGPLDRVFRAAAAHHDYLLVSLGGQDGTCDDGHWKNAAWYLGGYRQAHDDDGRGLAPISYWDYARAVVQRYAHAPALGMWEPINEPETSSCVAGYVGAACYRHLTCPNEARGAWALRQFFDTVGGAIHRIDPRHLVEAGFIGSGQCGSSGGDYAYVNASPGIDVLSYHDYYSAGAAVGGDRWNGIAVRLRQAKALGKPIIGGEVGVAAGSGPGCGTRAQRTADVRAKARRQMAAGSDGVLLWDWQPKPTGACDYSTYPGDPLLRLVGPR